MLAELSPQFRLDLLEVEGLHGGTRTPVDPRLVADDHASQRLRETPNGLAEVALEKLDDGRREVEFPSALQDVLLREVVGSQPLGEVSDDLGRWCNLDDVTALSKVS